MGGQAQVLVAAGAMVAIAAVTLATGFYGVRSRSTSDFLVASRTVGPQWNAAAISGGYLGAAAVLGIAGLVLKGGVDALWYPVGFTAGFVALLLFVAAPLRRSGAYTLPDFADVRLGSVRLRRICTAFVIIIGWLYLVPQLQGAGLTVTTIAGYPQWVGAAVVVVVVTVNLYTGWMRSITIVQAFQYWIKLTVLAIPVFVLLIYNAAQDPGFRNSVNTPGPPSFSQATDVRLDRDVVLEVTRPTQLNAAGNLDGQAVNGPVTWEPGQHRVAEGTTLRFDLGGQVPVINGAAVNNDTWLRPFGSGEHSLLTTYSLVVALLLGTMGLPHVLGRYYTNPDGPAARRTTLLVLVLLGVFFLFPIVSGWLARLYVPQLLVTGNTDAALLALPEVVGGWPGLVLCGLIAAGAFAAFVSAATGLVVSVAGALSTDVLPGRLRDFRVATLAAWSVPLAFALAVSSLDLAQGVGLAFAVSAATFCPLLVLGIWWRGLTDIGAAAGILVGGGVTLAAVFPAAAGLLSPQWEAILAQPAAVTVPLAFLTMVVVSRRTRDRVPVDVSRILLRLHAPDRLGLSEDRDVGQYGPRVGTGTPTPLWIRGGRHRR